MSVDGSAHRCKQRASDDSLTAFSAFPCNLFPSSAPQQNCRPPLRNPLSRMNMMERMCCTDEQVAKQVSPSLCLPTSPWQEPDPQVRQ